MITRERKPLVTLAAVNQMWALDLMHDALYGGRNFQLLNVINYGSSEALRIKCGSSIPSSWPLRLMDELIEFYGKPQAIRMSNGPEISSAKFVSWAERRGIKRSFIQPGKPNQSAFVERYSRGMWQEVLNAWLFDSLTQA